MSLIVAKILNGKIQIESDTKISGEHVVRNNPVNGRLKALILAHNLTVCYAGDVALAEDAYNFFIEKSKNKIAWSDYILYLTSLSKTNQVDFILCGYSPQPFILKIVNGKIEQADSSWIGDKVAFSEFQNYFLDSTNDDTTSSHFTNSFHKVVMNQLNETVGEFHITVKTNTESFKDQGKNVFVFQYNTKSEHVVGRSKTLRFEKKGEAIPLPLGNASEGDYVISYFTNYTQQWASLGIYFEFGGFGILYPSGKLLNGIKYESKDAQEFVNAVFKDCGIELTGIQTMKDTMGFKLIGPEK